MKIIQFLLKILGWLSKNMGLIVGIIEQVLKVLTGIVHITPSRKDDLWVEKLDVGFAKIKAPLYKFSEWAGNL